MKAHPARYPAALPEYFIRMLTDKDDQVFDPFGGSCVTGEVAERLSRYWTCCEIIEDYLIGALGRFVGIEPVEKSNPKDESAYYRIPRPGLLWNGPSEPLDADGGKIRNPKKPKTTKPKANKTKGIEVKSTETSDVTVNGCIVI